MKLTVYSKARGVRTLKEGVSIEVYREKFPDAIVVKVPSVKTMEKWDAGGYCKAIDGCKVEPDGECPHGYPSWLMAMGFI